MGRIVVSWHSTGGIALEVHRLHGLPIGVARRLVEAEFLRLQDDVAVIRSHLTEADRERLLDAIAEALAEP
ncbi:hypothetical protein GCM10009831_24470 [Dietzia cercidiphylli]|uniref:Uncharacterized protein n=1 Tax=Dietzia cercidiphylli TaxID=498199 RepID=A0ABP4UXE5_9ACTN